MKRYLAVLLATMGFLTATADRAQAAQTTFKDITSYASGEQFRIVLAFDRQPKPVVKYYEKSIQIDVPNGHVRPGRRSFDVNHAGVKEINFYQISPDLLRIRVFPTAGVEELKSSFSTELTDEKLVLALGPKAANMVAPSEILTPATPEVSKNTVIGGDEAAIPAAEKSAEPVASPESVPVAAAEEGKGGDAVSRTLDEDKDLLAKLHNALEDIKNSDAAAKDGGGKSAATPVSFLKAPESQSLPQAPSMGEAVVKIGSALLIVLALIFIIAYGAKKYLGAMEGGFGAKRQLKVLSNHFIGVKKNVTIVEVAGEILVLGVTNNNISLLARYTDPEKIEGIRHAHRLPDKPMGMFKKLPLAAWLEKRKTPAPKKVNPAFARQMASYAETAEFSKPSAAAETEDNGITTRKDELVSNIARSIGQKFRTMEGMADQA